MPKTHRKRQTRTKSKSRRTRRTHKRNVKHLAKLLGGNCGCGAASTTMGGGYAPAQVVAPVPPASASVTQMKGGFAPSFSGLQESKFYPLNDFQNDPTMMGAASRLTPNVEIGMNKSVGGGRKKKQRKNKKTRPTKKMRGGISVGGLLSYASSSVLGNGLSDNIIANNGGLSGNVTAYQVLSGNHNPTTAVNEPVSKLYNEYNRQMA